MLEQQRIEYLQAMGIQLWMPRQVLDNAAEPSWLADTAAANVSSDSALGAPSVQGGHAADLLAGMGLDVAKSELQPKLEVTPTEISVSTITPAISNTAGDSNQRVDAVEPAQAIPTAVDISVPNFELFFALWPCGILWVSSKSFERTDHAFQTSVSYSLLGNTVPQANYSQFKWPYIEGSDEDQSMAVALRALTAQWEFMSGQGARGWVAMDESSLEWLSKVASKPVYSTSKANQIYSVSGKKQLWKALQNLSTSTSV
jgi:hypothetical protein